MRGCERRMDSKMRREEDGEWMTERLQEIIRCRFLGRHAPGLLRCGVEDLEVRRPMLVELHDRGDVAASVAVVRRRPHGHQLLVEHVLVALHHQLMGARDHVDVVRVVELLDNVAAEQETSAARTQTPAFDILRVGPQEIALEREAERDVSKQQQNNSCHAIEQKPRLTIAPSCGTSCLRSSTRI
jgi:hypothetical protein